jgi:hypothetical protein
MPRQLPLLADPMEGLKTQLFRAIFREIESDPLKLRLAGDCRPIMVKLHSQISFLGVLESAW